MALTRPDPPRTAGDDRPTSRHATRVPCQPVPTFRSFDGLKCGLTLDSDANEPGRLPGGGRIRLSGVAATIVVEDPTSVGRFSRRSIRRP